ncbi:alpha/beta hydrolase [Parapedobacter sp. 10938]|uniref:alpha/beta hydrolase n=1 Tax=Parapedobacter flavus TaxID=3110225 RepID=UPI002DBCBF25|nr:alpha/beta hydrolase [Parapedobacter sp. 10938]MEC3880831.1 alpha/beta hydrolase [Parapedobacter sp. 10938]
MENTIPDHIHYTIYQPPGGAIKAVVLILHGMQEHSGRYERFANYLKARGYAVLTYDHIGHGRTAKTEAELGFFRTNNPGGCLIDDAEHMVHFMAQRFAGEKLILMGHSMGSFIARLLLKRVPHHFAGAILMGTGGPNPLAALFRPVLSVVNQVAPKRRSERLNALFSKINNRKFRHEHPNDGTNWLSANLANRNAFLQDELCGVNFSNNAFFGLISVNVEATKSNWAENIPKSLPMLFVSGANDPIGDFGNGVIKTVRALRKGGFERVELKVYPGMRHEILNECDQKSVFDDIVVWLEKT